MTTIPLTGSQTVGPFFAPTLLREDARRNVLTRPETAGERIRIEGRVLDGDGMAVPDAMVEIWQANAHGRYNHPADQGPAALDPSFTGYGRSGTAEDGTYWFETIKPGSVPGRAGVPQVPHLNLAVFARGLLNHLYTRLYFAGEPGNEKDPVLGLVPQERRGTLMAQPDPARSGHWCFDIHLCGELETVFFDV